MKFLKKEKQEDYFSYKPVGDGWQYVIKNNKVDLAKHNKFYCCVWLFFI